MNLSQGLTIITAILGLPSLGFSAGGSDFFSRSQRPRLSLTHARPEQGAREETNMAVRNPRSQMLDQSRLRPAQETCNLVQDVACQTDNLRHRTRETTRANAQSALPCVSRQHFKRNFADMSGKPVTPDNLADQNQGINRAKLEDDKQSWASALDNPRVQALQNSCAHLRTAGHQLQHVKPWPTNVEQSRPSQRQNSDPEANLETPPATDRSRFSPPRDTIEARLVEEIENIRTLQDFNKIFGPERGKLGKLARQMALAIKDCKLKICVFDDISLTGSLQDTLPNLERLGLRTEELNEGLGIKFPENIEILERESAQFFMKKLKSISVVCLTSGMSGDDARRSETIGRMRQTEFDVLVCPIVSIQSALSHFPKACSLCILLPTIPRDAATQGLLAAKLQKALVPDQDNSEIYSGIKELILQVPCDNYARRTQTSFEMINFFVFFFPSLDTLIMDFSRDPVIKKSFHLPARFHPRAKSRMDALSISIEVQIFKTTGRAIRVVAPILFSTSKEP